MKLKKLTALLTAAILSVLNMLPVNAEEQESIFVDRQDNWVYQNGEARLGPSNFLLEADKQFLMDQMKNTEKFTLNQALGMEVSGVCNGLSVTSILASYDIITPSILGHPYAPYLYAVGSMPIDDYQLTDTAKSTINYYQTTQIFDVSRQSSARMMYDTTSEERLQYLLSCVEDGSPTRLVYSGYFRQETRSLHTVVAYGTEYGSWEYDGKTYDGRVLIYDPNTIILYDDTCLYFNTEDWSWTIPGSNSDSVTCALTFISDDIELINHAGLIEGTQYTTEDPFLGVLVTNELASDYTVSKAGVTEYGWVYTNEPNRSMKEFDGFYIDAIASAAVNFVTPDTESGYVLNLQVPQELETAMYYEDCLQYIYAEKGSQVVFTPDGYAAMYSAGTNYTRTNYTMEMVFNEGFYTGSWYDFTVSGTADKASLQRTEEGYILTSDNLKNVSVTAKNDDVQTNLIFSTDADSVLLCEVNETTLAAKIDTDGDGTYETAVRGATLGDLNADGNVNAVDASEILIAAANAAAGLESGLSEEQIVCADVNGDGNFNAVDASIVLMYGAYKGAGGELNFPTYIASL